MKLKNKYIALAILGGATFVACDDALDVTFPSEQDPDLTFSNVEDATMALNGVYVLFAEDPYTSRLSNVWMQNTDVEVMGPSAGRPNGGHRSDLWGLQACADVSFSDIYKAWNNNLEAINSANKVIEGINESAAKEDEEMQQILGEAVCLKAWRYLMLCNYWGDVPYYDVAAKWGQELDKPRTDKNIIYSGCLQELVDIEPKMKFSDVNTGGIERMNRDFCMGLIAKMALFRAGYGITNTGEAKKADEYLDVTNDPKLAVTYTDKDGNTKTARTGADYYQMAKDYCLKLMDLKGRQLTPNYSDVFTNQVNRVVPIGSPEVLYEVAFHEGDGGDVGWCIGVTNTNSKSNGTTTNQVGINPIYYMSFADNDIRRDATCSRYSHDNDTIALASGSTGMNVNKWDRFKCPAALGAASSKGTGINWPLMRYAEVLLMLAEAENELNGPTSIAKNALTTVRERAFAQSPTYTQDVTEYVDSVVAAGKDAFFNAIVDERAWEFGGECIRKWDLQRWNNYGEKLNASIKAQLAWAIAITPDLFALDPVKFEQDYQVSKYMDWADKLYYTKPLQTKDERDIQWVNHKYTVTDPSAIDGKLSIDWGKKMVKSVTTYIYNGEEYTEKPVKATNAETGEVTYTLKKNNESIVVTATKDAETGETISGITKKMDYQSSDWTTRLYRGYNGGTPDLQGTGTVPYLLPIGTTTLSTSAVLNNDGYIFGYDKEDVNITLGTVVTPYK